MVKTKKKRARKLFTAQCQIWEDILVNMTVQVVLKLENFGCKQTMVIFLRFHALLRKMKCTVNVKSFTERRKLVNNGGFAKFKVPYFSQNTVKSIEIQ